MLTIRTYNEDGTIRQEIEANYASFVSDTTFGPPPVIAPKDGRAPLARPGDTVVYVNTAAMDIFTITRDEEND